MDFLIIGANSYIGEYIYARMKEESVSVVGTGHVNRCVKDFLKYDILTDDIGEVIDKLEEKPQTAIICIAATSLDGCLEDYETAYDINVVKMKILIQKLLENNIQVIYFSSDNVFDGTKGGYVETDKTNAIGKYGMMKEELDHFLFENMPEVCVLRISKPISVQKSPRNLLTEWLDKYEKGEVIRLIKDNIISFISMEDIYQICLLASRNLMHGLYHISGDVPMTRKELLVVLFESAGLCVPEIEEWELGKFGFKDIRPLNVSMSNAKFKMETGYQFTPMKKVVAGYLKQNESGK